MTQHPTSADQSGTEGTDAHWGAGPDPLPNAHPVRIRSVAGLNPHALSPTTTTTTTTTTPVLQYPSTPGPDTARTRTDQSGLARTGAPARTRYPNAHQYSSTPVPHSSSKPVLQDPPTQHPTSAHPSRPERTGARCGAAPDPLPQRAPDFGTVRLRAEPHCPLSNYHYHYHVTRPLADRREGSGVPILQYSSTPVPQYSSTLVLQDPPTQHPTSAHQSRPERTGAHWGAAPDPLPQRAPDFGTVRLRAELSPTSTTM